MSKVVISYDEFFDVLDTLSQTQAKLADFEKVAYAIGKNTKTFNKTIKKYNNKILDINIKHAAVYESGDKKGTLIKDEKGNFTYTKEEAIAKEAEIRSFNESTFEIEIYQAKLTPEVVEAIGPVALEILEGVIFETSPVETEIKE